MEPAPWMRAEVLFAAALWLATPAVTVRAVPELTLRVAVPAALLLNVIEPTVALEVTVIEAPARMTAASPLAGTIPPVQLVVAFQLPPVAVVTRVAARHMGPPMRLKAIASDMERSFVTILSQGLRPCVAGASNFSVALRRSESETAAWNGFHITVEHRVCPGLCFLRIAKMKGYQCVTINPGPYSFAILIAGRGRRHPLVAGAIPG